MNAYQLITDNIIRQLEAGALPWVKPWHASGVDRNAISGRNYNGINRLLLASSGYQSPLWATYNQWQSKGVQVLKGQKATQIVLFKKITKESINEAGESETSAFAMLRTFSVFNAEQTDYKAPLIEAPQFNPIEACEATIQNTGAIIGHGGDKAFYAPSLDVIQLPEKTDFNSEAHYYATAFHELSHWTGAAHRLDRNLNAGLFGNPAYAFEELVAEIGAAYLCADHGIGGELRHAGYIQSWLKVLRDDNKAIFKAAAMAQKAADYINGKYQEDFNEEVIAA